MKLTARKVETAGPGRHTDGRGLMLLVKRSGARTWVLRYQRDGKRHDLGLGPYPEITLADARERALQERRKIVNGVDPIADRNRKKKLTFRSAAEALIENKRAGWRNPKHAAQWPSTLNTYAYPIIGDLDVRKIDTQAVLDVLRPIWNSKSETASRVRQRIEAVLDYAAAVGAREGENPARWRGHLANLLPKPSRVRAVEHHPAMNWHDTPALMQSLRQSTYPGARALAFLILTAARSSEVRGMRWSEVDLKAMVWTVPAGRIEAGKEHRVPLTLEALALLGEPGEPGDLVFDSQAKPGHPLSDMTLAAVLKRQGLGDITVHGFRSTFRDWAGETTAHPREVIEAALAHRLKDKAEAAYARGDLLQKRRLLMEDWTRHLLTR